MIAVYARCVLTPHVIVLMYIDALIIRSRASAQCGDKIASMTISFTLWSNNRANFFSKSPHLIEALAIDFFGL